MNKALHLHRLIHHKPLVTAMAAHNPLIACLVEEAGFDAVWASGFELSASMGVPDASIVSMAEHLEMTRHICAKVSLPVIADIDTGFGNAVNVHYAVKQYVGVGAAAIVMEDKNFPKDTSLREGGRQKLVTIEEFCGKIEAAIDSRENSGLMIIARTEALIAGAGVDEAIKRAKAYRAVGADMILVHSKSPTPDELLEFVTAWNEKTPLVIVPTAYPQFDENQAIETQKIKLLIYGNHGIRATIKAVRETFKRIRQDKGCLHIESTITPVKEVIELQGDRAMRDIEHRFLK